MTYEEFERELRAWLSKETEMIRQTLPYSKESKKQREQAKKGIRVRGEHRKGDDGLHPGYLSGRRAKGQGGFNLERTESGWKLWIDPVKVFYAKYVEMPNKRTADFWNILVVDRLKADLIAFLKGIDPDATIE